MKTRGHTLRKPDGPLTVAERNAVVEECLRKFPNPIGLLRRAHKKLYSHARDIGVDDEEMNDVCRLALAEAARKYDPAKGAFSTVASFQIRAEMQKFLRPLHRDHERRDGARLISLSTPPTGDSHKATAGNLTDALPAPPDSDVGRADRAELAAKLWQVICRRIPCPRRRRVVELRRGLNGNDEHTLDEIGVKLGVCKERVRQLEHYVIRECREELESLYRDYLTDHE